MPFVTAVATKFSKVGYVGSDVKDIIGRLASTTHLDLQHRYLAKQVNSEEEVKEKAKCKQAFDEYLLDRFVFNVKLELKMIYWDEPEIRKEILEGKHDQLRIWTIIRWKITHPVTHVSHQMTEWKNDTLANNRNYFNACWEKAYDNCKTPNFQTTAIDLIENKGIVFIDEIDKLIPHLDTPTVSDVPVQQELLSLIEGTTISTTIGNIKTHGILFICAGAFFSKKPSDLMPELLGRLPIHATLTSLGEDEFYRLLKEPEYNLVRIQKALMKTEGIELEFTDEALRLMARYAVKVSTNLLTKSCGLLIYFLYRRMLT